MISVHVRSLFTDFRHDPITIFPTVQFTYSDTLIVKIQLNGKSFSFYQLFILKRRRKLHEEKVNKLCELWVDWYNIAQNESTQRTHEPECY